ncbi:MICOS complex subunit MIC27 isoform X12 [Vulpes vulpes]|uniref:MICOS complex subunit n=1 Tax=Vulpes vulpes TaxID=9627 RepID=A0ABM4ZBY0_VULVU
MSSLMSSILFSTPMGKLTTVPAGLICASITVHAAKEEYKKQLVKPEQLPIYTAPPLQSKYVEEQPGHLQMGFASIRTTTSRYIGWCKGVYVFMKNGIMDTVQFGKDVYVYLKNPPRDFLPKIGVITVSGLAGLVSARKGKSSTSPPPEGDGLMMKRPSSVLQCSVSYSPGLGTSGSVSYVYFICPDIEFWPVFPSLQSSAETFFAFHELCLVPTE